MKLIPQTLVLAVLLSLAVGTTLTAADPPAAETNGKSTAAKKVVVATIKIHGMLPEQSQQAGLLGELQISLADLIARLDKAAQDKDVGAVVLKLRSPHIGRGKVEELRSAILRVRKAGKKVIAQVDDATAVDYMIATACEEIVMPESGTLMVPGVRAEVTFYKRLFDKIGVKADMMQVGDFKGAAEPMTRDKMSPEFRKQYESLVDDMYDQLVTTIAIGRKLEAPRVRELIDIGLFTSTKAKELRLIDTVAYHDELVASLKKRLTTDKGEKVEFADDYGKKKIDTEFSGMVGMIKLFELMAGSEPSKRSSSNKKVAIVHAEGAITSGESSSSIFGEQTLGSDTIVKALRTARDDKTVVAIVLRVDSPGGSALASDLIWRELQEIKKPVIASMGDVAASGGYYISMGCNKIFAEPGTITGSIGVVGGKMAMEGLYDKVGLTTDVISRGKNSGILSSSSPFTESERTAWTEMMREIYRQFTSKTAAARKLDIAKVETLAGGRIWTGRQAQASGLVDEVGTLRDAIQAAKKAAGMKEDEKAEIMNLPEPKGFFDQLFGGAGASAGTQMLSSAMTPELAQELQTAALWQRLFQEKAVLVMPYPVRIK